MNSWRPQENEKNSSSILLTESLGEFPWITDYSTSIISMSSKKRALPILKLDKYKQLEQLLNNDNDNRQTES
jgi:hypothetical protein